MMIGFGKGIRLNVEHIFLQEQELQIEERRKSPHRDFPRAHLRRVVP
jgi:hypothetical protein